MSTEAGKPTRAARNPPAGGRRREAKTVPAKTPRPRSSSPAGTWKQHVVLLVWYSLLLLLVGYAVVRPVYDRWFASLELREDLAPLQGGLDDIKRQYNGLKSELNRLGDGLKSLPDDADKLKNELKAALKVNQSDNVELVEQVKTQIKRLEDVLKTDPKTAGAMIKEQLKDVDKVLAKLKEGVDGASKEFKALDGHLASLKKSADEVKSATARVEKKLLVLEGERKGPPGVADLVVRLKAAEAELGKVPLELKSLREQLAVAVKDLKTLASARKEIPEPTDALVLVLNSSNLNLSNYKQAFLDLFSFPNRRRMVPHSRLAVALVEGEGGPQFLHEFTANQASANFRIPQPVSSTTDRLTELGPRVLGLFPEKSHKNRVCIVVASARCEPVPSSKFGQWEGLKVHVILIDRPDNIGTLCRGRNHQDWWEFCKYCGGYLELMPEQTTSPPDERVLRNLTDSLSALIDPTRR